MIASSGARPSVSGTKVKWNSVVVANCHRESVKALARTRLKTVPLIYLWLGFRVGFMGDRG